jgi:putative hydrolase of the HAD superfamily
LPDGTLRLSYAHTFRAISLDLDDTLWPLAPVIERAEAKTSEWFAKNAPGALAHLSPKGRAELRLAALSELAPGDARRHDLHHLRVRVYQMALAEGGHDKALAEPAFDVFHAARHAVEPYPDVTSALAALSARFELIAITNGTAEIGRVGLAKYFRLSVSPREAGAAKPDARIYRFACETLGLPYASVLHVGDDVALDVNAARDAGLEVAWINRLKLPWPGPGVEPRTFADLEALCRFLLVA